MRGMLLRGMLLSAGLLMLATATAAAEPTFVRGINLNGPALSIDGRRWEAGDAPGLVSQAAAFENQGVPLVPATDASRAAMIRSSRWNGDIVLNGVPDGRYTLFLYVWEDNDPETFSILVNGKEVAHDVHSGSAGVWQRLGPWVTQPRDGAIRIATRGGAANLSGLELWQG